MVARTPPKIEHLEEWEALPLSGRSGHVAPWRVEVTTDEGGDVVLDEEPAMISEELWYRDRRGRLAREEEALLDEWGYPRGDPVERLVVRWGGHKGRPIDDYSISRLLPFTFEIEGVSRHYGEEVDVTLRVVPSQLPEAAALLGG